MTDFKINSISFANGIQKDVSGLTIVVGPNNSGKSRLLKEVLSQITSTRSPGPVLQRVAFDIPNNFAQLITVTGAKFKFDASTQGETLRTVAADLRSEHRVSNDTGNYDGWPPNQKKNHFAHGFGNTLVLYLGTENRISLANKNESAKEDDQESNLLQVLYNQPSSKEEEIRNEVRSVYNKELVFDFSVPQIHSFRVTDEKVDIPEDQRDARPILRQLPRLDDQGDGLRSYVGLTTALTVVNRPVNLIDEPEAFLHPPQANRIGKLITSFQKKRGGQYIVATHSPDVLKGLLADAPNARILRITQQNTFNELTELSSADIESISNDPLLGSSRVLEGLFSNSTVVVEADADARVYQTILSKIAPDLETQFVIADNKQTVPKIVSLYKRMGVRTVGIVDIDFISDQAEIKNAANELNIDDESIQEILSCQKKIDDSVRKHSPATAVDSIKERYPILKNLYDELDQSTEEADNLLEKLSKFSKEANRISDLGKPWRTIKVGGKKAIDIELIDYFDKIYDLFKVSGVLINPLGELEACLQEVGVDHTTEKKNWFGKAMRLLKTCEISSDTQIAKFMEETVYSLNRGASEE